MPPCLYPLRAGLRFLAWRHVASRVGLAAAMGALLVLPTPLDAPAGQVEALEAMPAPCPDVEPGAMVDASPDGGYSQRLPVRKPETWRKAPCPPSPTRRAIDGYCFSLLAEKPPCVDGYEANGECVAPLMARKPIPSTIGR